MVFFTKLNFYTLRPRDDDPNLIARYQSLHTAVTSGCDDYFKKEMSGCTRDEWFFFAEKAYMKNHLLTLQTLLPYRVGKNRNFFPFEFWAGAIISGNYEVASYIADNISPDYSITLTKMKKCALDDACELGKLDLILYLLNTTNPPDISKIHGKCILLACYNNHIDVMRYILTLSKDKLPDVEYCNGWPFSTACAKGHVEIVKLFMFGENTINIHNNSDLALYSACRYKRYEIIDIILKHGQKPFCRIDNIIFRAVAHDDLYVIRLLLDNDCLSMWHTFGVYKFYDGSSNLEMICLLLVNMPLSEAKEKIGMMYRFCPKTNIQRLSDIKDVDDFCSRMHPENMTGDVLV